MLSRPAMLLGSLLFLIATMTAAQRRGQQATRGRMQYQIKNGLCSYTFWVPELPSCNPSSLEASNNTQNNQPLLVQMRLLFDHQMEKMENALRNNMQRMEKLEENIQTILGSKLQQVQQNIVQNHMATMLELGTNLLNETTAQNCKLTNMEAQASNQTSHMERQMMETLQTTDRLQKQMQEQRETLNQLHSRKSNLETRLHTMETEWETQLEGLRNERENVRQQLGQQNSSLTGIQQGLEALRNNSNLLQLQQQQLMQSLQLLKRMLEQGAGADVPGFRDCEDIRKSGFNKDGVYTIFVPNMNQPRRVFCVMDTSGGAWTLIQRRENGAVDFKRSWQEYKQGFGDPAGEHWLGNEVVHQLSSSANYSLRVEMEDWQGNTFYANFGYFQLDSEKEFYRIYLDKDSGISTRQGRLILRSNNFSTHDADHDNCGCNCAVIMSGGWWFDSCGPSNLNGVYYSADQYKQKINGIRWDHSSSSNISGPTIFSLRTSRMMMRPLHS